MSRGRKAPSALEPRSLMVAATGGHLMELVRLSGRLDAPGRPLWVTFDNRQSRSLLRDEDVEFVRFTAPRDYKNVAKNLPTAARILRENKVASVVSTGSAVALSFLPLARLAGIDCHYIESAARSDGPSVTGKLLGRLPGVALYTQYEQWSGPRWTFSGSVFDEFISVPHDPGALDALDIVVSLGTQPFRFDRLVEAVRRVLRPDWTVTWQVGANRYRDLPGTVHSMLDATTFAALCSAADVVITQAGVGSALTALEAGKHPVLAPRVLAAGEHVDDHQLLVAEELETRGLATRVDPLNLTAEMLLLAARRAVRPAENQETFALRASRSGPPSTV